MVRCSVAKVGTCCSEDRTGHPAWKYAARNSEGNIYIGTSCAEARMAFCKAHGTYGTKYCPGSVVSTPVPRKGVISSRFNDNYLNDRLTQVHTFGNTPAGQIKGSLTSRFPNGVPNLTPESAPAPAAKKGDITSQLCPYFKWMPISDDCKIQVLAGAAVVILGGAFLLKMLH